MCFLSHTITEVLTVLGENELLEFWDDITKRLKVFKSTGKKSEAITFSYYIIGRVLISNAH
jgi:hypothetical protein